MNNLISEFCPFKKKMFGNCPQADCKNSQIQIIWEFFHRMSFSLLLLETAKITVNCTTCNSPF